MIKPTYFSEEYQVDEHGNIYGKKGRKLKPSLNPHGYQIINYMKDGKQHGTSVHRTVAMAFVPNPENKPQVNHIDGNKTNNAATNLEWVTEHENMRHAIDALGFIPNLGRRKKVIASKDGEIIEFESLHEAGQWIDRKYGVKHGIHSVWRVLDGRRKSCYGYKWSYTG